MIFHTFYNTEMHQKCIVPRYLYKEKDGCRSVFILRFLNMETFLNRLMLSQYKQSNL